MKFTRQILLLLAVGVLLLSGCGDRNIDQALDSDANGFYCSSCKAKFYTDRDVFATRCPSCQKIKVEMVLGYVCTADKQTSYGPRGQGSAVCEKCGKSTSAISIPRESELKSWGAERKSRAEVGG